MRKVGECRPNVVLMDLRMPVLDGLAATQLIKSSWPETRVVVLTLYGADHAAAMSAGADVFLVKGCPSVELAQALESPPDQVQEVAR